MLTLETLPTLLEYLNFTQNGNVWTKTFANNAYLKVDFAKNELIYPEDLGLVVNERQTCNFNAPENFVVFECVHRLLEKGYQPKHIELEKKWALGHLQKSGRADICIFADDDKKNMLLIIECKTYGFEYNKALKILKEDGGQLFSYWQQDRSCQWLCLYTSDFSNDEIQLKYQTIRCDDDKNLLQLAEQDDSILLYKNAHKKEDLHQTWQETYASQLHDNTIFHENTIAYHIGIPPLRKKDLKDFSPDDKIINQFEEILRHNAVSDKENAFNRLIALFICKLVDEYNKSEEMEVAFQYKINEDNFETLQDRLQQLYKEGMEKFMKEEIFYVPDSYAKEIFARYQGENRNHAIKELEDTIKHLKFYTNNDFSFKDVHNKELFMQNGKILVEMVQLFEKYRIVYSAKHQFLGDLFEQLLNKGFKQNEGQFFTPSPITRFIWDSLPIKEKFADSETYPKVIDYACGSGHFLTEAVETINAVKNPDNNDWVRDSIFGIEKDYRLARVSQVSMFMNGAGDSNIIFGDGLDNHHEAKVVKNEEFDILVANPPYSVSAFKSHLSLKHNQLDLLKNISNQGGEIEVLFCERIDQLLKSGGMGAVILPSSILSNDSNSYSSARALLLSEFKIRAIVTLGSKTFGATGTNTVILFLEKFSYPPKINNSAKDCANTIFQQQDLILWNDKAVYDAYLNQINVGVDIYDKIRLKQITWDELHQADNEYLQLNIKAILAKFKFNKTEEKLTDDDKNLLKLKHFLNEFEKNEKEKIEFFFLTHQQTTLIINAPSDNTKQKEFLGYDWSHRKGAEGIQIIKAGGKLYDDKDRFAQNTLASLIRQMFMNTTCQIGDEYQEYAYMVKTCDMLDFSLASFNYALRTNIQKKVEIESKYPLDKLENICQVQYGIRITKKDAIGDKYPVYGGGGETFRCDEYNRENQYIISRFGMSPECVRFVAGKFFLNDSGMTIQADNSITTQYIELFLSCHQEMIYLMGRGSAQKNMDMEKFKNFKIPLPPPTIQEQIVKECQEIDKEYETARMSVEHYRQKIAEIFNELEVINQERERERIKLSKLMYTSSSIINPSEHDGIVNYIGLENIESNTGNLIGNYIHQYSDIKSAKNSFKTGDILFGKLRPNLNKVYLADIDGICSTDILVFSTYNNVNTKLMYYYLLSKVFNDKVVATVSGQQLPRTSWDKIKNIRIALPSPTEQQKIITQIEQYEQEIQKAEIIISNIAERKKAVLTQYLTQ